MKQFLVWLLAFFAIAILTTLLLGGNTPTPLQSDILQRELDDLRQRGFSYRMLDNGLLATEHPVTHRRHRYSTAFLESPREPRYPSLPTLTINLQTIDTNSFSKTYHYVNSIPCTGGEGFSLLSGDINNNSRKEIYGLYLERNEPNSSTRIYELGDSGQWVMRYVYPSPAGIVEGIDDIDRNGLPEIYARYSNFVHVFEQPSLNQYPTNLKFSCRVSTDGGIAIPFVLVDVNNDSVNDLIYRGSEQDSTSPISQKTFVARYDQIANSFVPIWSRQLPPGCSSNDCAGNMGVGDFDSDSLKDIVTSAYAGNCYVIEYAHQDSLRVVWSDSLSTAGRVCSGDVDGNGMEEFFVGGNQGEIDGLVHLRAYAYERVGDNMYQPYFAFNIFPVGFFHSDLYQIVDIDADGQEELLVSFRDGDIIIKGEGPHNYSLFFYKRVPSSDGMSAVDVNGDRFRELLLSTFNSNQQVVTNTGVFQLDTTLAEIGEPTTYPNKLTLSQNYPNPFNPTTTISYDLPIDSKVTLKVFDMLGREVATLVDGFAKAGYHQATLNATNLASGLYFYRMQAGSFMSVKKMVLVK